MENTRELNIPRIVAQVVMATVAGGPAAQLPLRRGIPHPQRALLARRSPNEHPHAPASGPDPSVGAGQHPRHRATVMAITLPLRKLRAAAEQSRPHHGRTRPVSDRTILPNYFPALIDGRIQ